MGLDDAAANASCAMWIEADFDAFNALLSEDPERGDVCFGEAPTLAEVALIPEL
jgi:maleylpyruvate isomerase